MEYDQASFADMLLEIGGESELWLPLYLTSHTVMRPLIFISLGIILIPLTHKHPSFAINLFHCDRRSPF
jgi:hypothetical protein